MGMFKSAWFRRLAGQASSEPISSDVAPPAVAPDAGEVAVHVIFATETGVAEDFAEQTCKLLKDKGVAACEVPMDELSLERLQTMQRALFLVSTTGMGEPPYMAEEFFDEHMQEPAKLADLACGVLALGSTCYPDFCQFGRDLCEWLRSSGVCMLFEPVHMDDEDEAAADTWHKQVAALATSLVAQPATVA